MTISMSARSGGLPLLSSYRESRRSRRSRLPLILVTHVLPTSVPFIRALAQDFDVVSIIAIPYSLSSSAREDLAEVEIVVPANTSELERELLALVLDRDQLGMPYLVQETGGYLAPAFEAGHRFQHPIGVVEDTRQGHWRYQALGDSLTVPVMSVAESPLKALEHQQIGRAIVFSLERQVRQHFYRSLSGESVAVVGFGDIGSAAARALQGRLAHVIVYDVDPLRQASAWMQGFRVSGLTEAISTSNLVLGCSGSQSLTQEVLRHAPDGAVFASGSSKQVEIDIDFFTEAAAVEGNLLMREHDGRRLFLLNEGKPINFVDGSAIGSTLDLVYTELYACTEALAQESINDRGLLGLSQGERQRIAQTWLDLYAAPHRPNLSAVVATSEEPT